VHHDSCHQHFHHRFCLSHRAPRQSPPLPYTTLFRSALYASRARCATRSRPPALKGESPPPRGLAGWSDPGENPFQPGLDLGALRSEEHTSELQSRFELVCRRLLEKKKRNVGRPLASM